MKTKILSILALGAALLGMSACSEDWDPKTEKTGQARFSNMGVEVLGAEKLMQGRAETDLNPYLVKIYRKDAQPEQLVEQWTYGEMPEIFTLPVGDYRVDVMSHEVEKAAWESPLYSGSREFTIENAKITDVGNITCTFASLKVTVNFTDDLRDVMGDDVQVRVVANDAGELIFTPDETRAGYFEVVDGSNTMAYYFTGTVSGAAENFFGTYTDVEAGQHRKITFSLKKNPVVPDPETGTIDPSDGIHVDTNIDNEDINGDVNPDEDVITPDDPWQEDIKTKVNISSAMAFGTELDPAAVTDANVTVSCGNAGLASLVFTLTSTDADVSALDLAAYGIPTQAQVQGQKSVTVDLASLLARLATAEGTHTVTIAATDADSNSIEKQLIFKVAGKEAIEFTTELTGFGIPMRPLDETSGKVTITAPAGIARLILGINSTDDIDGFGGVTSTLNGVDLCNPGSAAEMLDTFGLANGDAVLNQTEANFDITMFLKEGMLPNFRGTHTFSFEVTDNAGNTAKRELIFKVD